MFHREASVETIKFPKVVSIVSIVTNVMLSITVKLAENWEYGLQNILSQYLRGKVPLASLPTTLKTATPFPKIKFIFFIPIEKGFA